VTAVALSDLRYGPQVRDQRISLDHVWRLVAVFEALPPIVVRRADGAVLDGHHRWAAAKELGRTHIDAEVIDCDDAEAAVIAVARNIAHGQPLTLSERKAAARRFLADHSEWSDNRIAEVCGLTHKTVGDLRPRRESPNVDKRRGRDEKSYPSDPAPRREAAARALRDQPDRPLRDVAEEVGLSPETVRDVKRRIEADEPPVPPKLRPVPSPEPTDETKVRDLVTPIPKRWADDPACRRSDAANAFARWFDSVVRHDFTTWERHLEAVPAEHADLVVSLARQQARFWTEFASRLSHPQNRRLQAR
jgi:ParB-like chromosome segregation protein Spo0J